MGDRGSDTGNSGEVVHLRTRGAATRRNGPRRRSRLLPTKGHLPTLSDPFSPATEQFRLLRVRVEELLGPRPEGGNAIAFTSPLPAEGKTSCSLTLAMIAAQDIHRGVIFVECDLRVPSVASMVDRPPREGIADVLAGRAELEDVIISVEAPRNLRLILAGVPPANPVELLGSPRMAAVMDRLRRSCDLVVVDTPPALDFADASELAPLLDGFMLVVRSGQTPRDAMLTAHRRLSGYGVLGAVLNDLPRSRSPGYAYRYYRPRPDETDHHD
ncbi:MAG: CpsD/CapB family tyrosine-protein kinase [Acidobacteriota bacterium]